MSAARLNPLDAAWLFTESRATPNHVGGLLQFRLPEGAPRDYLRQLMADFRSHRDFTRAVEPAPEGAPSTRTRCRPGSRTTTSTSSTTCATPRCPGRAASASWANWSAGCRARRST